MISLGSRRPDPARLSLLLCGAAVSAPFLLPEHHAPLRSFYDEWLGVALGTAALVLAYAFPGGASGASPARGVPRASLWLAAFAAWLGLQPLFLPPAPWQLAFAGGVYALYAALLVALGHSLARTLGPERVADTLAAFLLAGALANAVIGIVQLCGVPDALQDWIGRAAGPATVGHVGQANLYADYLALGEASLLYAYMRGRLRGVAACAAGALLAFAGAASLSRSALLFSLWLALLATLVARRDPRPEMRRGALGAWLLVAATAAALAGLAWRAAEPGADMAVPALARAFAPHIWQADPRWDAWRLGLRVFLDSPWLGAGWGRFAGAAFGTGLTPALTDYAPVWTSPHNIVLQLLAESGLVGAALVLVPAWGWARDAAAGLRRTPDAAAPDRAPLGAAALDRAPLGTAAPDRAPLGAQWWIATVAGVVALHALLEYPLWYAHVLGLIALVVGIGAQRSLPVNPARLRPLVLAGGVALAVLLAWTLGDGLRLKRDYVVALGATLAPSARVEHARGVLEQLRRGPLGAKAEPWLYRSLPFGRDGLAAKLVAGERVMRYRPEPALVARYAADLALAGRGAEAARLLARASAAGPRFGRSVAAALAPLARLEPAALRPLLGRPGARAQP